MNSNELDFQAIVSKPYARRLVPDEGGGFVASILEFPGCFAQGETADEALNNLERAAESWLEAAVAQGREIREPIAMFGHSGKVALRLPRSLHQQASEIAEIEQTSLNQFIVYALAAHVAGKNTLFRSQDQHFHQHRNHFLVIAPPNGVVSPGQVFGTAQSAIARVFNMPFTASSNNLVAST